MSAEKPPGSRPDRPASPQGRASLREELGELIAAQGAGPGPWDGEHPPAELLASYAEGELPAAEADLVQEHLSRCAQCAELVLDYETFPAFDLEPHGEDPGEVPPWASAGEVGSLPLTPWTGARPTVGEAVMRGGKGDPELAPPAAGRLPSAQAFPAGEGRDQGRGRERRSSEPHLWTLVAVLAASLAVGSIGVGIWRTSAPQLVRPWTGIPSLDAMPVASRDRGGEPRDGLLAVSAASGGHLHLYGVEGAPQALFRLSWRRLPDGRPEEVVTRLPEDRLLTVTFPPGSLQSGLYEVRVEPAAARGALPSAVYRFQVVP